LRSVRQYPLRRNVFNECLKQSSEMLSSHADSRRLFGSEFQDIGPATAKARWPNVLRQWRSTTSWRRLAER